MSRAARTLGAVVAVVCCLAPAAVTPASAAGQVRDRSGDHASRAQTRPDRGDDVSRSGFRRDRRSADLTRSVRQVVRPRTRPPVAPERPQLSIETVTPSRLVPGTPVRISGTVLNNTDDVWGDAQVGMLVAGSPFTSTSQVAAATRADPYEDFAGDQVLEAGTFDDIGDVAPGQSRSFSFAVPYDELELDGNDGVYWAGAELRATDGDGLRGSVARSLTFLPLVGDAAEAPTVDLAMLWPLIAPVPWNGEQFVDGSMTAALGTAGRLRTLAEIGASARTQPLTWVLDPAVLDAARRMSDGFTQQGRELTAQSGAATNAADWLDTVRAALGRSVALAVPYGNPDLAALAHAGVRPGMHWAAVAGDRVLDNLGVARLGLLWPAGGRADQQVLQAAREQLDAEVALLSRDTFATPPAGSVVELPTPRPRGQDRTPLGRAPRAQPAMVVDRELSREGLRAQPGQSTLQWRQLILAHTALLSLAGGAGGSGGSAGDTAIAMPSSRWWPDAAWRDAELFDGLQVPWLNRVSVNALTDGAHPTYAGGYDYPRRTRRHELGPGILDTARRIRRTARTVNHLLTDPDENRLETSKAFGLSTSVAWRSDPQTGRDVGDDFLTRNRDMIRSIDLEAPEFVTLSSNSGRFPISITNRLDQPVTVRLAVSARDPRMSVAPIAPVTLQRDQRVTVTVVTNSRGVGITTLTSRMATQAGRPFGPSATFQVRTTQIGTVVWVVMGVGAAVLFIAAGRRIFLRVRNHRRSVRRGR